MTAINQPVIAGVFNKLTGKVVETITDISEVNALFTKVNHEYNRETPDEYLAFSFKATRNNLSHLTAKLNKEGLLQEGELPAQIRIYHRRYIIAGKQEFLDEFNAELKLIDEIVDDCAKLYKDSPEKFKVVSNNLKDRREALEASIEAFVETIHHLNQEIKKLQAKQ